MEILTGNCPILICGHNILLRSVPHILHCTTTIPSKQCFQKVLHKISGRNSANTDSDCLPKTLPHENKNERSILPGDLRVKRPRYPDRAKVA